MRILLTLSMVACLFAEAAAQSIPAQTTAASKVQWSARDTSGAQIAVPAPDGPTIVVFLRPGQTQSEEMLRQINDLVARQPTRVTIVLSGPDNAAAAQKIAPLNKSNWPIVLDADYAIAGRMSVHVWPETIVVATDGAQIARFAGLPHSFAADLATHLDFAASKIDQAARDRRLTTRNVVAATSQQAATRYLIIANALIERDQLEQARSEIERGLAAAPDEPSLRLALARVLLRQKRFDDVLPMADQLAGAVPAWQLNELRAEALIGLQRWPDAQSAIADALKLNPKPSHAHYLAGLIYAHEKDFEHAADSFRRAYESVASQKRR